MFRQLSDNWFLTEPAFFALYCQQQLTENPKMDCPVRCGQGRLEYNPLLIKHKSYAEVEQLMRIELIRLFLKHPYERQPEGCCREAMSVGSNITIADGYCMLHKEKLPLHDPTYYHLPLGQYYEWYVKQIQQQQDDNRKDQPKENNTSSSPSADSSSSHSSGKDSNQSHHAGLWREDELQRQRINDLIERTTDWGTIPGEIVEQIKASTRAQIDRRLIWQGFHSAVLSSQRCLTRMRPNRRTGFLQMGSTRQFDTHLLAAIDVSGSITDLQLSDFYSSINRLFRYGVMQIDVCQFDAIMGPIISMQRARQEITVKGRGGTSFQPVFDYISEHSNDYDGLLILTDGQAPPPQVNKTHRLPPVLWVTTDRNTFEQSKDWMKQTGRVTYL